MTLIELLVVGAACVVLALLGRTLFGAHGGLLGAVPFGLVAGLVALF